MSTVNAYHEIQWCRTIGWKAFSRRCTELLVSLQALVMRKDDVPVLTFDI